MRTNFFIPVLILLMPLAQADQGLASPRLKELLASAPIDTSEFWGKIEREGTPLIEPIQGELAHVLMTFLWRGDAETKNVILSGGLASDNPYSNALHRLGATDIWYKTFRVRDDLLVSYSFGINDKQLLSTATGIPHDANSPIKLHRDPFNGKRFGTNSVIEMKNAPSDRWTKDDPDVPEGNLETFHDFQSLRLGYSRTISVYTPHNYDNYKNPLGLLVVFDREAYARRVPTPRILDNLIHAKLMDPMVVVLVGNVRDKRHTELIFNDDFVASISTELVPWLRERYNVSTNPADNGLAGSSLGGLASIYTAFKHPELFGNVISQAGSVWIAPDLRWYHPDPEIESEHIVKLYMEAEPKPIRFSIEMGLHDYGHGQVRSLYATRDFRDALKLKGYEIAHYSEVSAGHEYLVWRRTLADHILALFGTKPIDEP